MNFGNHFSLSAPATPDPRNVSTSGNDNTNESSLLRSDIGNSTISTSTESARLLATTEPGNHTAYLDSAIATEEAAAQALLSRTLVDARRRQGSREVIDKLPPAATAPNLEMRQMAHKLDDGRDTSSELMKQLATDALLNRVIQEERLQASKTVNPEINQLNFAAADAASRQISALRATAAYQQQLNQRNYTTAANSLNKTDALTAVILNQRAMETQRLLSHYNTVPSSDRLRMHQAAIMAQDFKERHSTTTDLASSSRNPSCPTVASNDMSATGLANLLAGSGPLTPTHPFAVRAQTTNPHHLSNLLAPSITALPHEVPQTKLPPSSCSKKRKGRPPVFPKMLHRILSDLESMPGGTEIASFLPDGKAFQVHKPKEFAEKVIPLYFHMTCFASFQRQLRTYGFRQFSIGTDRGAYYHEYFVRGQPALCERIQRVV